MFVIGVDPKRRSQTAPLSTTRPRSSPTALAVELGYLSLRVV